MSADSDSKAVLVVGLADDPHAEVVLDRLARRGVTCLRFSYNDLDATSVSWTPDGGLSLATGTRGEVTVGRSTTIWWRRPGLPPAGALGVEEDARSIDEVAAIFPSGLDSSGPRWVDSPWRQAQAGGKLAQLAVASRIDISVPPTLVTNSPEIASKWATELGGPAVAKPVSSGVGISPYVGVVPESEFWRLAHIPTMLQGLVQADQDLRLVTIGSQVLAWSRPRHPGDSPDWRRVDPAGRTFVPCDASRVAADALRLAAAFDLTFTVQDWLLSDDCAPTFLEINPQGQWLFLEDAVRIVVPKLVDHLIGE
ncbi:MAG: hypothetical protein U0Q22_08455 [Acidimicrobiales bacterium]